MHYKVQNQVASRFARIFYECLAKNQPVEVAVHEGRKDILRPTSSWEQRSSFGLPVLYLRGSGGLLNLATADTVTRKRAGPRSTAVVAEFRCPWCKRRMPSTFPRCGDCLGPFKCSAGHPVLAKATYCVECDPPTLLRPPDESRIHLTAGTGFDERVG